MRSSSRDETLPSSARQGDIPGGGGLVAGHRADLLALALMLLFAVNAFLMVAIPIVRIELQDTLSLSSSQVGLLTSIYTFTYCALAVPMGMAAARWGGRTVMAAIGLIVVGLVLFAVSSSFGWFMAARFLQGCGAACAMPVGTAIIVRAIVPERRDRALGIFGAGLGFGTVVGFVSLRFAQEVGGYRAVFWVILGLAVVTGVAVLLNKAVRTAPPHSREETSAANLLHGLGKVAVNPRIWLLVIINTTASAVTVAVIVWAPGFLEDQRDALNLAAYLTAALGVAQLVGNPAGAALMGRWGKPATLLAAMGAMTVFTAAVPLPPGLLPAFVLILIVGFLTIAPLPPVLGSIPEIVSRPEDIGPATGFIGVTNLIGMVSAPWIFGLLLDAYGRAPGEPGYLIGFLALAIFPLIGALAGLIYRLVTRGTDGAKLAARPAGR